MAKQIEARFLPDGTIEIEAHGYSGPECEKATRALEEALGVVTKKTLKPDHARRSVLAAESKTS